MEPTAITTILSKYCLLLLLLFLFIHWLLFLSPFKIPTFIPFTPINISGLLIGLSIIAILILVQKSILKKQVSFSFFKLLLTGIIVVYLAELLFQFLIIFIPPGNSLHYILSNLIRTAIFGGILSLLIAFQLKTKRTKLLLLFIGIFILFCNILIHFKVLI